MANSRSNRTLDIMVRNEMKENSEKRAYYYILIILSLIGFCISFSRSRLGVCLTDDAYYTADLYMQANGAIPYVNYWTQAPGVSLPLFILYKVFIVVSGGTEGIFLFTRICYCVWKTIVSATSLVFLRNGGVSINPVLVLPIICFNVHQLFAINYNTIGISYLFFVISIISLAVYINNKGLENKGFIVSILAGIVMGRCIIGTPATIVGCLVIIVFLSIHKKIRVLRGFIIGEMISALLVVGFCCIKGGIDGFVIGIQYFFKDLSYYDGLKTKGVPFLTTTQYVFEYMIPFLVVIIVVIGASIILRNNDKLFNYLLIIVMIIMMAFALSKLPNYTGVVYGLSNSTRFGWFIPILAAFFRCEEKMRIELRYLRLICIAYVGVYLLQGYTVMYGINSRCYWNYIPMVLGIASLYTCLKSIFKRINIYFLKGASALAGVVIAFFVVRGSYMYAFDELVCSKLNVEVDEGVWKGCYTTQQRADTVILLENSLRNKTDVDDEVLCYGAWSCFLTLIHDGNNCTPSSLGAGNKNGFDYWHMRQVVPNKVLVRTDEGDEDRLSDKYPVGAFISKYYEPTDNIEYASYDVDGIITRCRICLFEIVDQEGAQRYADEMATDVFYPW